MLLEIKTLSKHFLIYSLGNILAKTLSFALLPLYTRYLTPSDYGTLELLDLTILLTYLIVSGGISEAVVRFYHFYDDPRDREAVISTALLLNFVVSTLSCSIFLLSAPLFARSVLGSPDPKYVGLFRLAFLTLFFDCLSIVPYAYVSASKNSLLYLILSLIRWSLGSAVSIYFLVGRGYGILSVFYGNLFTSSAISLSLYPYILRKVRLTFSSAKMWDLLKFGIPLIPAGFGLFILNFSDRFFLKYFSTLTDVGVYAVGYKFGLVIHVLLTVPFVQIWGVQRYEVAKQQGSQQLFARVFTYYLLTLAFVGLGITALMKDLISVIAPPAYMAAYKVVPLVVLSYVFFGVFHNFSIAFDLTNKTGYLSLIYLVAVPLNLLFNFGLIPRYGAFGAALATFFSFLSLALLTYALSLKVYRVAVEFDRVLKMFVVGVLFFFALDSIELGSWYINLIVKASGVLLYPSALYLSGFFDDTEKLKLKEMTSTVVLKIQKLQT